MRSGLGNGGLARRSGALVGLSWLVLGCAATTPSTPSPIETLIILNSGEPSLTVLSLPVAGPASTIHLGNIGGTPHFLAARGDQGLITTGVGNTVAKVGFTEGQSPLVHRFPAGAGAAGVAFVNDTLAYVAHPFIDRATRLNLKSGDTASVATGHTPTAVAVTRGRVYVANSNLEQACAGPQPCVQGASWLSVIDPERNVVVDSIPIVGPGNAVAIEVGADGLLYVLSAGAAGTEAGRLSIVDPVQRVEVGSFAGFGPLPNDIASDHRERLFVTSLAQGLMEFNSRTRRVVRGAGSAIPLQNAQSVVVGDDGLIYAIESGHCGGDSGHIRIFRPDLTEALVIAAGPCSVDAAIVKLSPPPA